MAGVSRVSARRDYAALMAQLRMEFGNLCAFFGSGSCRGRLEFAHVKPTGLCGRGRGRAERYHDIKRNPECYRLMCRSHHRRFDADYVLRLAGDPSALEAPA